MRLGSLGIRPAFRPRGSRAFLVEERNQVPIGAIFRVRESHRESGEDIIFTQGRTVMKDMALQRGFSANQTVCGAAITDFLSPLVAAKERNGDLLPRPPAASPLLTSLYSREVAHTALTNVTDQKRVARLLSTIITYVQQSARAGDRILLSRSISRRDPTWFVPGKVPYMERGPSFLSYSGLVVTVPHQLLTGYNPESGPAQLLHGDVESMAQRM